ncbi:MAG: DUF1223 domain-containing protein [Robiginitomaculum sp.]
MKAFATCAILLASLALTPSAFASARAAEQLVELFTSQGCSSSPASNALLTDWADDAGILGLTYSVEYWDYLGWIDTFADPRYSARQRDYAAAIGHGRVYTPQMVVNGALDKTRFNRLEIENKILPTGLTIGFENGVVSISGTQQSPLNASVYLVRYTAGTQNVVVMAGENSGKTLPLTNVVTDITRLGGYNHGGLTLAVNLDMENHAYAVIVQSAGNGPVLAAATLS